MNKQETLNQLSEIILSIYQYVFSGCISMMEANILIKDILMIDKRIYKRVIINCELIPNELEIKDHIKDEFESQFSGQFG